MTLKMKQKKQKKVNLFNLIFQMTQIQQVLKKRRQEEAKGVIKDKKKTLLRINPLLNSLLMNNP